LNGNHKIRTLGVHTRFDSESVAMDCQKALTVFAGERLPRIMEEVFNSRSQSSLIRRFGRVELDLGAIPEDEFPDGIDDRLRQKLEAFLDDHPVLPEPGLSVESSRQLASGPAAEEAILYFLENGVLPWHGSFSNIGEMVTFLETRLKTGAASFIKRLKDVPDTKIMVKRLARQFPETFLEKILETALTGRGRLTRGVLLRLDAFYAAGICGQTGKESASRVDIVQDIKSLVWEHMLLITLGAPGIFPILLKLVLPQHSSAEVRQEIFRILRRLPGSSALALAEGAPYHPDASPTPPCVWAKRLQEVLQTSGRKSDCVTDSDFPRIWGEVLLHCFKALNNDSLVKLETVLNPSPVSVSLLSDTTKGERKFHQTITDSPLDNCPDKQTRGNQMRRLAKGKFTKASSGKRVLNGEDESENGAWTMAGAAILDAETAKNGAALSNTVQKNEAGERQEPFQSGIGSHSLWTEKIYADFQKNSVKTPRVADPDFPQLQGKEILRAFASLSDDILVKLEMAFKPFPVPVSLQRGNTEAESESHHTLTDSSLDTCPDKQSPGNQIRRRTKGQVVKKISGKEVANGADNSDNEVRGGDESRTLRTEIPEDGADTIMTGLSMEDIAGPVHGDSLDGNWDSGVLDEDVPSTAVQKDEAEKGDALFQYSVGRDAFGTDKNQVGRQKSGRKSVSVADPEFHRIRQRDDILRGSESLADGIKGELETALRPSSVSVSHQRENTATEPESDPILADSLLDNCPDKQPPGDQIGRPDEGKSVKEIVNDTDESDNGSRIEAGDPILRNEFIKGGADTVMTGQPMEKLVRPSRGGFRGGNLDSGLLDKTSPTSTVKKYEITKNPILFQSGSGTPFVKSGEIGDNVYLKWIQHLLDGLGRMTDKEVSSRLTGETLSVIGDMIFEAAVSMPEPDVFLAELSSMIARQLADGAALSKNTGRMLVETLTEQFRYGAGPLTARMGGGRPDEPVSGFSRNFAGKTLENLRPGTLWQVILSKAWRWILTSGPAPGFSEPDHTSDNSTPYLPAMDSLLSLPPEKREPFSIRVLYRFAERMQLPSTPFPDFPGAEAQTEDADASKIGKTMSQARETDGDSGPALRPSLDFRAADQSLPDPGQEACNVSSDSKHRVVIPFEELRQLFQSSVVQNNMRSTLNLEEIWNVIQVILQQKGGEKGFETVWVKLKSDACIQQQNPSDDKIDKDLDTLADKLSLVLKNGPDPKDFLLRMLTALVSGDSKKEYGPGEHPKSSVPGHKKLENPPAEKNLERGGGACPSWHPAEDPRVTGAGTHSAVDSREWGRETEPVFVENAGMVLAGPYLSMLFKKLDLLDNKAFKSHYAAEKAVHILEHMVTGGQSAPEYRLVLNKLLCGLEPDRPIHKFFLVEKAQTDVTRELILSMIAHWKVLGKTSVEGFRQSFFTREGRLEATEDAWNLVVAPKPFDMLLDRIPWTFSPIRLPWMDRVLYVHWR
jgi:hypothetical protein